jgi:tetratricopeptide (TPR) repeat protein
MRPRHITNRPSLQPDYANAHCNLGLALVKQGRIDEAVARYERALALQPDYAEAHYNLGILLNEQGQRDAAIGHFARTLALKPDYADAHNNLGIALAATGQIEEAVAHYKRALALNPNDAKAHNNLGLALATQGRIDAAVAHYKWAILIDPHQAEPYNNLGNIFKDQGMFEEAVAHYGKAITNRPGYAEVHFNRADLKTFSPGDADLEALESLAARDDMPAKKAAFIRFALAKALEDSGDYVGAFEHLRQANALKRGQTHYDEAKVVDLFARIAKVFDRRLFDRFQFDRFQEEAGDPSAVPIFVLGMPRSGSTLIEQILASHPQVHGAGELADLEIAANLIVEAFPEGVSTLEAITLRRMAQAYLARLPALPDGKTRIVDKMPDNFLRIGLIHLILPNAKIVHTTRAPMDTCISCYSKLFTDGLPFTYDMEELGHYYRCYSELMAHWRSTLPPGTMLDVSHEELVDDLEGQARRLIEYCGLTWDEQCVSFHKTRRPVKTASAVQVRRPLFRGSLQRWRRYEAGLAPLLQALGDLVPEQPRP